MLPTTLSRIWNLSPNSLSNIRQEFEQAIDSLSSGSCCRQFPLSISESETGVQLQIDVPGFTEDALSVEIEDNVLTISGERQVPEFEGECSHREHQFGEFNRSIKLGESLDLGSVNAELDNGVLTLQIAKKEEALPTKIAVSLKKPKTTE
jgi:HSP20 family protein